MVGTIPLLLPLALLPWRERHNAVDQHAPTTLEGGYTVQGNAHAADLPQTLFPTQIPLVAAPATIRVVLPCLHHQPGGVAARCAIVVDRKLMIGDTPSWVLKGLARVPKRFACQDFPHQGALRPGLRLTHYIIRED